MLSAPWAGIPEHTNRAANKTFLMLKKFCGTVAHN